MIPSQNGGMYIALPENRQMSGHTIAVTDLKSLYPTPLLPTDHEAILASLAENGFTVVNVMGPNTAELRYNEFWDWLEALGSGISRDHPRTWDAQKNWPHHVHGIIKSYGIGQADFIWKCRTEPAIRQVFAKIWNVDEEDLIVSFDGGCMYPSSAISPSPLSAAQTNKTAGVVNQNESTTTINSAYLKPDNTLTLWPHRDQSITNTTLDCVQGCLNLTSNLSDTDGGLIVYPKTHLIDWLARYPHAATQSNPEFFKVSTTDCPPSQSHVLRAPAGCLFLWDSRTIHCNRPPLESPMSHTRCVVYICMTPRARADAGTLGRRIKAYKTWATTGHCPHQLKLNPDKGKFKSKSVVDPEKVLERVRASEVLGIRDKVVRRLVGYNS
ncbi:hypothetical protein HK104_001396 [Borealophlyctis nickersoniae]|nr:hypothetical protein HK104_001396 [Borealophlyctis nickersoniae]